MPEIDSQQLASSLRRIGKAANEDIGAAVNETVQAAVAVFGVCGSGLMIADEENVLRYVAASDEASRVMEQVQSDTGDGPCVAAFVTNQAVATTDVRSDPRWTAVRPSFAEHGVIAVLGVPVRLGGVPVGSLDVFLDEPHEWDDSERAALQRYGDVVEATLAAALAAQRAGELAGQLQYALDYRIVIERAVGYLMAQRGADPVEAFDVLRRTARSQRRKVAEVAQYLLDHGVLPLVR